MPSITELLCGPEVARASLKQLLRQVREGTYNVLQQLKNARRLNPYDPQFWGAVANILRETTYNIKNYPKSYQKLVWYCVRQTPIKVFLTKPEFIQYFALKYRINKLKHKKRAYRSIKKFSKFRRFSKTRRYYRRQKKFYRKRSYRRSYRRYRRY